MMGKLPLGVVSPYVKMSSGGCTDPLKFYATSYCTAYGREEFKPRTGSHMGTGYKSNFRRMASYQANLDALSSPATGTREQARDNFQTVTGQSYRPLEVPDGSGPLPWSVHQTNSGYGQERPNTGPLTTEVRKVHFDTQDHGAQAIVGLEPKERPLLFQQQDKGSLAWENGGYGPRFMTSEYNSKYLKEPSNLPDLLQKKSIGAKEETGFTEESNKNPIVFQPPSQALPGDSVLLPGRTVTKADFVPMSLPHGDENLPVLARGSERETGYSRATERPLNLRVPSLGPEPGSLSHRQFQPPQRLQQSNVAMLGRETIGNKELTGFSLNNPSYVRSAYDPDRDSRYLTTYNQGYFENIPKGIDREGWTRGGIQPQTPGGYAINHPVTHMEATPNPMESLQRLHPHVGRTLTSTDPFYRDSPYGGYTPYSGRYLPPNRN
nr:protein phosphatase 1 regulatory subunit 32 isoform X1 [Oryctolagus cuniculus]XP_008272633.2 protein phosphatase 1 regulatory subunit 32 isoform X1 [Oryctolagus cuniculus]XP_008272634.2 protein phosphatase 1 regulatory subunit 32 isoform X1 [Oryctolagus cuniculus]